MQNDSDIDMTFLTYASPSLLYRAESRQAILPFSKWTPAQMARSSKHFAHMLTMHTPYSGQTRNFEQLLQIFVLLYNRFSNTAHTSVIIGGF